jgi:hypothetical protein
VILTSPAFANTEATPDHAELSALLARKL